SEFSLMLAEAVANAVRHGRASTVEVSIEKANGEFVVKVRDDGGGFPKRRTTDAPELFATNTAPVSLDARILELGGTLGVLKSLRELTLSTIRPALCFSRQRPLTVSCSMLSMRAQRVSY